MSCMSSSLYGGLHLYRNEEEPSAAELLEASKALYVKTDVLKDTKIGPATPRIFRSPTKEDDDSCRYALRRPRIVAVKPSGTAFRPSANSAFRPISKAAAGEAEEQAAASAAAAAAAADDVTAPPRPPKSSRIKQRARRLHQESAPSPPGHHRGSPPPPELPPREQRREKELGRRQSAPASEMTKPVPAPRLSKLSSTSTPPAPLPRRRTIQIDGALIDMSKSTPDLLSPNSSRHSPCLPSTLIRKRLAPSLVRPATPLPAQEVSVAREEKSRSPQSGRGTQHGSSSRRGTQTLLTPCSSSGFPLSSPTSTGRATSKDSGVRSEEEDEEWRKNSPSLSDEIAVVMDEDEDSIFTSITNQPRREETAIPPEPSALSSSLARPLSVIEKHTRIVTWLQTSATVPEHEEPHHTTHHAAPLHHNVTAHYELTV